jgi:hypothetical protein
VTEGLEGSGTSFHFLIFTKVTSGPLLLSLASDPEKLVTCHLQFVTHGAYQFTLLQIKLVTYHLSFVTRFCHYNKVISCHNFYHNNLPDGIIS